MTYLETVSAVIVGLASYRVVVHLGTICFNAGGEAYIRLRDHMLRKR